MTSRFFFISGLPRSGSTLVSSLLRQNPDVHARVVSPVYELVHAVLPRLSRQSEFHSFYDKDVRRSVLRGLFTSFYAGIDKRVVFDSNRLWTTRLNILFDLFPETRVICMVRDINEILNSFECLLARNPLEVTAMFGYSPASSIYARVDHLMNSEIGTVGLPWLGLREAWFGEHADRLILIEYDALVREPREVLANLYEQLKLKPSRHNFEDVLYGEPDYDASLGMPGLHSVRKSIGRSWNRLLLPPDIISRQSGHSFWKSPQSGKKSHVIL